MLHKYLYSCRKTVYELIQQICHQTNHRVEFYKENHLVNNELEILQLLNVLKINNNRNQSNHLIHNKLKIILMNKIFKPVKIIRKRKFIY